MSFRRKIDGKCVEDSHAIDNIQYNSYSGGQKNLEVGPALKYISNTAAEVAVCPGDQLFLFKTTVGVGYVQMAEVAGIGAVPGAPAGDVFPVLGESFTRYSAADYKFIKGSADIHLYILRDDNQVRQEP